MTKLCGLFRIRDHPPVSCPVDTECPEIGVCQGREATFHGAPVSNVEKPPAGLMNLATSLNT
jgi:hypothetical protein